MTVRTDNTPKHWRIQADSLYELLQWVEDTSPVWRSSASKAARSKSWDLGVGYDGAVRLARDGWEDGIQRMSALIETVPSETIFVKSYDVAGAVPDVPRFLGGDPRNMINRGKEQKPKPTMSIAFNMSARADVSAQAIWNFGAGLVAIIDRLESRKVRCEVSAIWRTENLGRAGAVASICTTLKRPEEALDLHQMAFGVAHPAMLRRINFAAIERSRADIECPGYGMPNSRLSEVDIIDPVPGTLFIGGIGDAVSSCSTVESAVRYVAAKINEAAGEPIAELEVAE